GFHVIQVVAGTQRLHWIFALPWSFKDVAIGIDLAANVPCFAANAHLVLDKVVVGLQVLVADGPVLKCSSIRNVARTVSLSDRTTDTKIPRIQAPALCVIMYRRPPNGIHHRMSGTLYGRLR